MLFSEIIERRSDTATADERQYFRRAPCARGMILASMHMNVHYLEHTIVLLWKLTLDWYFHIEEVHVITVKVRY